MRRVLRLVGLVAAGIACVLTVGQTPALAQPSDGWVHEGQTWQYVEAGTRVTGWHAIDGSWYYFDAAGTMRTGWQYLGGSWYYLRDSGAMATGWLRVDDSWYYLCASGAMATGWLWDGATYWQLASSGAWTGASQRPQAIMGPTTVTAQQMARAYRQAVGESSYPSSVYASQGAATIDQFCRVLVEEADTEGVSGEIVFAQVMLETNWLSFGGDVSVEQCNFAGIGAVGGGAKGNDLRMDLDGDGSSDGVRAGLRVQVQHLKAYASTADLVRARLDPRFGYVRRGSVTMVQGLGIPDYPAGVGWAADAGYGMRIVSLEDRYLGLGY